MSSRNPVSSQSENWDDISITIRTGTSTRPARPHPNERWNIWIENHPVRDNGSNTIFTPLLFVTQGDINYPQEDDLERDSNINVDIEEKICGRREVEQGVECSICQEKLKLGDTIGALPCHHLFHYDCIGEWGKYKQECPLCRGRIPILER